MFLLCQITHIQSHVAFSVLLEVIQCNLIGTYTFVNYMSRITMMHALTPPYPDASVWREIKTISFGDSRDSLMKCSISLKYILHGIHWKLIGFVFAYDEFCILLEQSHSNRDFSSHFCSLNFNSFHRNLTFHSSHPCHRFDRSSGA